MEINKNSRSYLRFPSAHGTFHEKFGAIKYQDPLYALRALPYQISVRAIDTLFLYSFYYYF
jgi:hypothetical protein